MGLAKKISLFRRMQARLKGVKRSIKKIKERHPKHLHTELTYTSGIRNK